MVTLSARFIRPGATTATVAGARVKRGLQEYLVRVVTGWA